LYLVCIAWRYSKRAKLLIDSGIGDIIQADLKDYVMLAPVITGWGVRIFVYIIIGRMA